MDKQLEHADTCIPWHYKVRRSARAKRIKLSFASSTGLELVLPRRASLQDGLAFMLTQQDWIQSLADRHQVDLQSPPEAPPIPESILLKATGEHFAVVRGSRLGLLERKNELVLKATPEQAPLLLQRWMLFKGKQVLLPWLAACSLRTGLPYQSAGVRNQSSRWGSYSSRGAVSLNCRLLLLEPEQVEYVLLHELSHSAHMNHSPDFWQLLESVCDNARALDRSVDLAARQVPEWISYKP
ncbi:MAG: M48 family metallopeptidase [Granulosicoccaceae bacterium]